MAQNKILLDSIGRRIRYARERAGLSQAELARRCKVSRGAVSQWESDLVTNVRLGHLYAVADATAVNPRWVSTGKGDPTANRRLPPEIESELAELSDDQIRELLQYARFITTRDPA